MRGVPYAFPPFWVLLLVVPIWRAQALYHAARRCWAVVFPPARVEEP